MMECWHIFSVRKERTFGVWPMNFVSPKHPFSTARWVVSVCDNLTERNPQETHHFQDLALWNPSFKTALKIQQKWPVIVCLVTCAISQAIVHLKKICLLCLKFHHHHCPWGSLGHYGWFYNQFPPFFMFSTALWDLANSRPVHSLMLSSHLFLYLPCLLPPFTVPCKMVLAIPDERETWP